MWIVVVAKIIWDSVHSMDTAWISVTQDLLRLSASHVSKVAFVGKCLSDIRCTFCDENFHFRFAHLGNNELLIYNCSMIFHQGLSRHRKEAPPYLLNSFDVVNRLHRRL